MRRCVVLALFLVSSFVLCAAQKPQAPTPKVVPLTPVAPVATTLRDYAREGYVIEKYRTTFSFENDGSGKREVQVRVKVQSEAGVEQWGQIIIGYSSANERVEIPYVRVLKADGSVVTATADSVQDLTAPVAREAPVYTDFHQKHITVPGLRPGEILEYDIVTVIQTPLAAGQFWMDHDFLKRGIVLDEQLEVNVPQGRAVKLKTAKDASPKTSDENGRTIYRWTSSNLDPEDDEKDSKGKKKKKSSITTPKAPAVQMTTFASWEEMGRWYGSLEHDRRQPTQEVRDKAAQLTQGKATDLEKISALYDYVATNFRYISLSFGVGRYQPHAAADVLHNQYGDCKDKHTLLASLLEASGYHASSVLIDSNRKLDPDVPSPSQFDHVISLVPLGKEEIWMDTTSEIAPFRLLAAPLRKKQALVIPANGVPHLEETPADPPGANSQVQEIDGKVNEFGKLEAHIKFTSVGDSELLMRSIFRRVPGARWEQLVKQISLYGGLDGEVSNLEVGDPAATRQPFLFQYDIKVASFFDWSRKKGDVTLPLSTVLLPDVDDDPAPDAENIQLGSPGEFVYRLRLEFPAKYSAQAPLPFSMKRDYGNYEATYKVEGNIFTAERRIKTTERELPPARTTDYLAFRRAVTADTAQRLAVDSSAAGTPTATADLKGDDLEDAAKGAMERANFQSAIDLLKKAVEADPKRKSAWGMLGRAYMALRQTDHAVDAFNKLADLDPYNEYAYNDLGWAYATDRKYEQAVTAYNKAIDINPLSEYAHAALGGVFAQQKQYEKAVPELAKAVQLKPNDAGLQAGLGDAYLNLGQDDKALAAFDKAVEISATPDIWNNIAYQLSLKQAHLDRAQQYAESAVTATSAGLRNASVDQLTLRDLLSVNSLIAQWDTLGWVYFYRGDLNKAEKYISAAWLLGQHGEVGDHLAQLYEKRGQKEDAVRTYAMALSAIRPPTETRGHLAALAGGDGKVNAEIEKYRGQLQETRTIKLGKIAKETGDAEFFVMLVGGVGGTTVEAVKFIGGDDKLKTFTDILRTAKYGVTFPDDTPTRVPRRGILSCSKLTGDCTFVMMLPEDVRSVN